jgi:cell division protein FtsB
MTSRFAGFVLSALILYFAYNAFAGDKGLGHWSDMQSEVEEKQAELDMLTTDISRLERDIARLTPGTIDPDFVEALARQKLAFVYPDEIILIEN